MLSTAPLAWRLDGTRTRKLRLAAFALSFSMLTLSANEGKAQSNAPGAITLQSLVQRMVDRDALAEFPAYASTTGEVTSKDPRARTEYFYGDNDGGNFQRDIAKGASGGVEHVMMDVTGPGAITRLFVAGPSFAGHNIRFYIDGSATPVLTSDLNKLMTGGSFVGSPFVYGSGPATIATPYSGNVPPGLDLYLPMPFAKQMLVTYDGPANSSTDPSGDVYPELDYVFEYVRYAPQTTVTSFDPSQYTNNKSALATYYDQLSPTANTTLPASASYTGATTPIFNQSLAVGASATYTLPSGAHAIRLLQGNVGAGASALAGINLTINFDGESDCVDAPFANFFGTGSGLHSGTTQVQSVGSDGIMTSRWTMPYQSSGTITIKNTTGSAISVYLAADIGSWTWDAYSMHFHAYRRINGPMYMHNNTHTMRMMYIAGQGVFVGDNEVVTEAQPSGDTAQPNWWGEGDELIYVDGSPFPTHRGTGSEDYFGYAYSHIYLFQAPWASQSAVPPQDNPQPNPPVFNYDGATVLNRNRMLDVIPFNDHLRYDFEIHENNDVNSDVQVDHTTFFYAIPGTVSLYPGGPQNGGIYTLESKINGWNLTATTSAVTTDVKTEDGTQQFAATSVGTNQYTLENVAAGLYLGAANTSAGTVLNLSSSNSGCEQKWTIVDTYDTGTAIPDPIGNGFNGYQSMINGCGLSADVVDGGTAAGTTVQQYTVNGADSQYWRFNETSGDKPLLPDGIYTINNSGTGLLLDVPNASKSQSQTLQVWTPDSTTAQQWTIEYLGNGTYSVLNVNSNMALDNSGKGQGQAVDQYPWTTGSNMTWRLIHAGPGVWNIQNVDNGLYLSVGGNQQKSSPVIQEPLGSGSDQVWTFTPVLSNS